ncbi:amidase family protein [Nemania abortiva]|nr:amidase family protein [Nemania abortiva]
MIGIQFFFWPLALIAAALAILLNLPLRNTYLPRAVNLLTATATDISALLDSGRISSAQLVEECLQRIHSHDQNGLHLNSVLGLVPRHQLRSTAALLDNERRRGILRSAVHGVPILIKGNFATEPSLGLPTSGGAFALANVTTKYDAVAVHQLREAGAIILGKTNLDELCSWKGDNLGSGWSKLGGTTRSPYTFGSPCGSSGGSAVAVAAGLVPFALGTETTGSITCPASFLALYGFVGSKDLVSSHGLSPVSSSFDRPGILSKSVADLAVVLDVIARPGESKTKYLGSLNDSTSWTDFRLGLADPDFFNKTHGLYHEEIGELKMHDEISNAVMRMRALGAEVNMNASFPSAQFLPQSFGEIQRIIRHEIKSSFASFSRETDAPVKNLADLVLFNKEHWSDALKKDGLHFPQGQEILERSVGESLDSAEYDDIMNTLYTWAVTSGLEYAFKTHSVDFLVVPGWSWITIYSAIAGAPMGTVPLGQFPDGRPFGLTFVGRRGQDAKLLQLMQFYEKTFPPRRTPSSMNSVLGNWYFRLTNGIL